MLSSLPDSPIALDVPPEIIGSFARLKNARTLREVYTVPTLSIGQLQKPETFAGWSKHVTKRPYEDGKIISANSGIEIGEDIRWENSPFSPPAEMEENLSLAKAFMDAVDPHRQDKHWNIFAERQMVQRVNVSTKTAEEIPHLKDQGATPLTLHFICASQEPLLVVPHYVTFKLIKGLAPTLLDRDIAEDRLAKDFSDFCTKHADIFHEAAKPTQANAVQVITGATISFDPLAHPGRVSCNIGCW